jgi:3D (Asp-Asp-Asp) domain-containing protein
MNFRLIYKRMLLAAYIVVGTIGIWAVVNWLNGNDQKLKIIEEIKEWTPDVVVIREAQRSEFEATGYAIGPPYSTITKLGHPVFNKGSITIGGMDVFTIAVDPKVIPLGSIVYIDSLGMAMATDTGPKIKGMIIDVCFANMQEAMSWGRRKVSVTVLRRGQ